MMRMKTAKPTALSPRNDNGGARGGGSEPGAEWELRPGGMLVQKRNPGTDRSSVPPPTIRVRVKFGSTYHEMRVSSQATFGDLKKMLTGPTGLHHRDQKLIYKDKERDSNAFLDITGVKDKSKIVLVEDPISQEKRLLEMRRSAKLEKASKSISEISLEVDRLAGQVSALESIISKGGKVAEKDVLNLIELLMNQLLKLDGIMGDGDVKLQRKMQVRRVQKYVETLDMLKIKNSMPNGNGVGHVQTQQHQQKHSNGGQRLPPIEEQQQHKYANGQKLAPIQEHQQYKYANGQKLAPIQEEEQQHPRFANGQGLYANGHGLPLIQEQQSRQSVGNLPIHHNHHQQQQQQQQPQPQPQPSSHSTGAVVVTTQWETFDSYPLTLVPSTSTSTSANNDSAAHQPTFPWDFFN